MAQLIPDGYKPTFEGNALSAYFNGVNAANVDDASQEELLKQYLANQREQQMIPLDMESKTLDNRGKVFENMKRSLEGNRANALNTPEGLRQFVADYMSTTDQNINKGETSNLLQPFVREQLPIEQNAKTAILQQDNQLAQIDQLLSNGGFDSYGNQASPDQMKQWQTLRDQMIARRGQTPELYGKTSIENIKGEFDLEKARIMAGAQTSAAQIGAKAAWTQALPSAVAMVSKTQEQLAKLEQNQLQEEIAVRVRLSGKKPGTKEYEQALVSEKDRLRAQLQAEYAEAQNFLRQVQYNAGNSMATPPQTGGQQPTTPAPQQKVIKLD